MSEASHPDETPHRYTARLANEIEPRWQERWAREGTFRQPNPGEPGFDPSRPKRYVLDMFPYPSGAGLHVGHPEGYTATDIFGRYWRMKGCNVLHPMGWDAFGLPAEQYAVQTGVHPSITTRKAIENFRRQLSRFGFAYDWSREFGTIDPEYYRWTQWIWLQAYHAWFDPDLGKARPIAELAERVAAKDAEIPVEGGTRKWSRCSELERKRWLDGQRLVYLGEQTVNWCPKLGTVLANEEVIDGRSERGGHPVLRLPHHRVRRSPDRGPEAGRLAGVDAGDAGGVDRPERGRRDPLRRSVRGDGRRRLDRLHHAARHALRRDLHGRRARASAGRAAAGEPGRRDRRDRAPRLRRARPQPVGRRSPGRRQGQDRRVHRDVRAEPRDRRGDSRLDRRLRAHGLRNRRDHGGAGA
jgi:hypothetical protein